MKMTNLLKCLCLSSILFSSVGFAGDWTLSSVPTLSKGPSTSSATVKNFDVRFTWNKRAAPVETALVRFTLCRQPNTDFAKCPSYNRIVKEFTENIADLKEVVFEDIPQLGIYKVQAERISANGIALQTRSYDIRLPVFGPPKIQLNGSQLDLVFNSVVGQQYIIQSSSDMTNWSTLYSVLGASQSISTKVTLDKPSSPRTFFRVVQVEPTSSSFAASSSGAGSNEGGQ